MVICAAVGCSKRSGRDKVSFFRFPCVDMKRNYKHSDLILRQRKLWIAKIKRRDLNHRKIKYARICSLHFISGRPSKDPLHPDFAPSIFYFESEHSSKKNSVTNYQKHIKKLKTDSLVSRADEVQRSSVKPLRSLILPKPTITVTKKSNLKDTMSEKILEQQENGESEAGRKKPKCHMCSREFLNFTDVLEHLKANHPVWFRNMEFISCCIPGCQSKSHRKMEHSIATGEKNILMFPVPHADGLYNKWKTALKETDFELTKDDHICEHHFLDSDIERFHRTKTPDGDIIEIKKKLPTLRPDAVPIKFKKSSQAEKNVSAKLSSIQNSVVISSVKSLSGESSLDCNSSDSRNNEFEIFYDSSVEIKQEPVDSSDNSTHKEKCISFSELVKNIQLVKKPSASWSVVCTDKFIIFARWNNRFIAEKRIVIENSLTVRVFLKDWEIEMTDLVDITSFDGITSLLEKVEGYNMDSAC